MPNIIVSRPVGSPPPEKSRFQQGTETLAAHPELAAIAYTVITCAQCSIDCSSNDPQQVSVAMLKANGFLKDRRTGKVFDLDTIDDLSQLQRMDLSAYDPDVIGFEEGLNEALQGNSDATVLGIRRESYGQQLQNAQCGDGLLDRSKCQGAVSMEVVDRLGRPGPLRLQVVVNKPASGSPAPVAASPPPSAPQAPPPTPSKSGPVISRIVTR